MENDEKMTGGLVRDKRPIHKNWRSLKKCRKGVIKGSPNERQTVVKTAWTQIKLSLFVAYSGINIS